MTIKMEIKYIYNEKGERESVVIPVAEWERLQKNAPPENETSAPPARDLSEFRGAGKSYQKEFIAYINELDRQKHCE